MSEVIDFENIEQKLQTALESIEYKKLIASFTSAKKIYLIGNGGLHFVANHMATDCSRLIKDKVVYSFESVGFITSNANDYGYDTLFIRWLETVCFGIEENNQTLIIGLSCSGNSKNVIDALKIADHKNFHTFLISGVKSKTKDPFTDELVLNCLYFHTVEVLTLMIFYHLIGETGNHCPDIAGENKRKGHTA